MPMIGEGISGSTQEERAPFLCFVILRRRARVRLCLIGKTVQIIHARLKEPRQDLRLLDGGIAHSPLDLGVVRLVDTCEHLDFYL